MPWDDFWPILIILLGAGLLVLVAELIYRAVRKGVRWLGRRAERRLAQGRAQANAPTDDSDEQPAAADPKFKRLTAISAAFLRHMEQLIERLYRPFQLLMALVGAQLIAAPIDVAADDTESSDTELSDTASTDTASTDAGTSDNDIFGQLVGGLWDGISLAGIWIGLVAGLWLIALIGGVGWFGSDIGRRFRSQVETATRVLSVLVFVAIIVIVFIQLDQAQALGATVLAGAGLIGVVAGLAAQRFLANMFAGMAIGFSDKLNIGDMVEFDGESGTVSARTLTYVALALSGQRTLVIPTSQFLDQAHKDWKITKKQVVGWVPLQVDWGVSVPNLLAALRRGYQHHGYGDGEDLRVEVTGVTESAVQVRAMVRATPDDLWKVQCDIRAYLVAWIDSQGTPRPRLRADITRHTTARATSSARTTPAPTQPNPARGRRARSTSTPT